MIGAIILGLIAGALGKLLVPGKQPGGILGTIAIGLIGALVGYFIFTRGLGIGDNDAFDLGGLLSAVIGVVIVLVAYQAVAGRRARA
ncbi:GlsB/YeaQ/YmgE family stress response membrane protein [Patulibacter sp. NPDC049589]|uniref:GlsB/YeaQ/YmgE family stress response membrane protein n=1 Tax=Patulibacter sp. NPDC049589 TaxID=3154731 RepID=UPI003422A883